jgi:hypothetical protein
MVCRLIADHCVYAFVLHEQYGLNWCGYRCAELDVAAVLQNGVCAIEMVTVASWLMLPNQTCGGVATFAPIRNVLTTIRIVANGTEMCSL